MFDLAALDRAEGALCKETGQTLPKVEIAPKPASCPVAQTTTGTCPVAHGGQRG